MDLDQWNQYKEKSKTWAVRIDFALLHSKAYKAMNYAPALKMLNWFHEKIRVRVNKRKRGRNRFQIINGADISFTYQEAKQRGLSSHQTTKALRELYRFGFIDIKQPGSALRGDWTRYSFSERWRNYGMPEFKNLTFPISSRWVNFGKPWPKGKKPEKKHAKGAFLGADSNSYT